jgi:hypothetical protein
MGDGIVHSACGADRVQNHIRRLSAAGNQDIDPRQMVAAMESQSVPGSALYRSACCYREELIIPGQSGENILDKKHQPYLPCSLGSRDDQEQAHDKVEVKGPDGRPAYEIESRPVLHTEPNAVVWWKLPDVILVF